ncbi:hypothetical protein [Halobaculum lipolyticum]|uniref:DNA recombination and repair protein Rad51-like C-terminal domain-containing protein n=1 Tax=Halobaculum lipolyticum TaxID=3032001 RepID=A0ABD5WFJ4_9EURY|nr:hypothetical protein [Halobaculum sp. DT31]
MNRTDAHAGVELPTLDPGLTLLDIDSALGIEPLCAVVLDQLLEAPGEVVWVDAGGHVRTRTLTRLAPHPRYLDRITAARGFTAYQHASLLDRLPRIVSNIVADGESLSLVVVPAMDQLYREDDVPREQAQDLLVRRLATLAGVAREREVPVLLTRDRDDDLSAPLAAAAHETLTCTETRFGPRFSDDQGDDETLVYHTGDGWMQTTLAFWREILEHRARAVGGVVDETDAGVSSKPEPGPVAPVTPDGW